MKHSLLLSFLLCASIIVQASTLSRSDAQALDLQAQEAYAAGDHATALMLFDSVASTYSSVDLFYNIGNCHFKLGDVPRSILNYERALRLDPGAEDVLTNLEMARTQVVDRLDRMPGFGLGGTWGKFRGGSDVDQWARWALWGCVAMFVAFGLGSIVRPRWLRNTAFSLGSGLLLFTLVSTAFAAWRSAEIRDTSEAIILAAKVDARSEPRAGSPVLFVLHKGTKVTLLQTQDAWHEVALPNGNVGWMPAESMERI